MSELWELPSSWEWAEFSQVAEVASNLVDPTGHPALPHIAPNHIESWTGRLLPWRTVGEDGVTSPKHMFACGQILYSKIRPYLAKATIVPFQGLCSADMYPLHTDLNPRYLLHWLLTPQFTQQASHVQGRTVLPKINKEQLARLQVPIAPLPEQERIVAAIEATFPRIDAAEAGLERARRRLRAMRAAVLDTAVRNDGLTGEQTDLDLDETSHDHNGWRIVTVGDIAEVSGGITKNPRRSPKSNAIPFLRVANVLRDGLDLKDVHEVEVFDGELERLRLVTGDLLVVEGNGSPDQIGRSALWDGSIDPCVHQNHLIRVRPGKYVVPEYLNIFWNSPHGMRVVQSVASSTSGLRTLSTGKIRAIPVPLPSISTQEEIVAAVANSLSWIERMEATIRPALRHAQSLRASILARAFSGQLVPHDPNDEPALVFLKQIAAERAPFNGQRRVRPRRARQDKVTV